MSLFDWLLLAHLAGDFLFQTDRMAQRKKREWPWILRHVGTYMVGVALVVVLYSLDHSVPAWLAAGAILFLAATHIVLDRRAWVQGWMRWNGSSPEHPWLPIVVDQVFHLLALGAAAQVLVLAATGATR
jgi:hypothetical protein